jgi:hypothetical protein
MKYLRSTFSKAAQLGEDHIAEHSKHEVLVHILSLGKARCSRIGKFYTPRYSRCRLYTLAPTRASHPSHIVIDVRGLCSKGLYPRAILWLRHVGNAPLSIHIDEDDQYSLSTERIVQNGDLSELLEPYVTQLSELRINLSDHGPLFPDLTWMWIREGPPGSLKTLVLSASSAYNYDANDGIQRLLELGTWSLEQPNPYLVGVSCLCLKNSFFPHVSRSYHGLVKLELDLTGPITFWVPNIHSQACLNSIVYSR